ncbi:hypothetical protein sos41_08610 [Alphaproteobacteria bacterium SO-S41]|nr:hypothetical protein sos41_08610 [Alphaproteobacteria bacterium SO-S41]
MKGHKRYIAVLFLIFALIGAYVGYWYYAMGKAKEAFAAAVASERAQGNTLDFKSVEWGGFPIRISATIQGLRYAGHGYEADADIMMAEVLPWNPTHALIRADGNVRLASRLPDRVEWIEFRPETMIASLRVTFGGLLEGADVEFRQVRSDGTDFDGNDFSFNAARLQGDIIYLPSTDKPINEYSRDAANLAFSADQLLISDGFAPTLGPRISTIRIAAKLSGLPLISQNSPFNDPRFKRSDYMLDIARLDFDWGGVSAKGNGKLKLDDVARPAGDLDFKIIGLGKLIEALRANGTLQAPASVEGLPDVPGGTPISLAIENGRVTFGPFLVGTVGAID